MPEDSYVEIESQGHTFDKCNDDLEGAVSCEDSPTVPTPPAKTGRYKIGLVAANASFQITTTLTNNVSTGTVNGVFKISALYGRSVTHTGKVVRPTSCYYFDTWREQVACSVTFAQGQKGLWAFPMKTTHDLNANSQIVFSAVGFDFSDCSTGLSGASSCTAVTEGAVVVVRAVVKDTLFQVQMTLRNPTVVGPATFTVVGKYPAALGGGAAHSGTLPAGTLVDTINGAATTSSNKSSVPDSRYTFALVRDLSPVSDDAICTISNMVRFGPNFTLATLPTDGSQKVATKLTVINSSTIEVKLSGIAAEKEFEFSIDNVKNSANAVTDKKFAVSCIGTTAEVTHTGFADAPDIEEAGAGVITMAKGGGITITNNLTGEKAGYIFQLHTNTTITSGSWLYVDCLTNDASNPLDFTPCAEGLEGASKCEGISASRGKYRVGSLTEDFELKTTLRNPSGPTGLVFRVSVNEQANFDSPDLQGPIILNALSGKVTPNKRIVATLAEFAFELTVTAGTVLNQSTITVSAPNADFTTCNENIQGALSCKGNLGLATVFLKDVAATKIEFTIEGVQPLETQVTEITVEILSGSQVTHSGALPTFRVVDLGPVGQDAWVVYGSKSQITEKAIFGFKNLDPQTKYVQIVSKTPNNLLSTDVAEKTLGRHTELVIVDYTNIRTFVKSINRSNKVTYAHIELLEDKQYGVQIDVHKDLEVTICLFNIVLLGADLKPLFTYQIFGPVLTKKTDSAGEGIRIDNSFHPFPSLLRLFGSSEAPLSSMREKIRWSP
eukprot:Platyproteum_vivax@DN7505_c0_g3_i1.p1